MPDFFCNFCNEKRPEKHISKCPACGGQLHERQSVKECATCGKVFPVAKPMPVKELQAPELEPVLVERPKKVETSLAKLDKEL